ncbi:hypothetical protein R3X25_10930 [Lutibacter sp. TH_r2]|uniref:hypothetical protein n=1 Tax=Lutibacter sp. TH_r2 TaxID=3082083 RepID=UPI002952FBFD|nr:hypothetical protein [Lutibacter sp. TH_r2]MDV7187796.1 hypothetical protein [Lutibacter sp. TH_r2]
MRFIYVLFLLTSLNVFSQNTFSIYYKKNIYNEETNKYLETNKNFKSYNILIQHFIDPKNEGIINLEKVERYLIKTFPNKNEGGVLCINLENQIFKNLRDNNCGKKYRKAVSDFKKLIKLIKNIRPNFQVGIYGLPFRTYYKSQFKWNENRKLDPILKLTDIIFPSLYIFYPDIDGNWTNTNNYLERNLNTAFSYAQRLDKVVIPFMWYMVHPSNKKHRNELIDLEAMQHYIEFVKNYQYKGNSVRGIVYWDLPENYFKKGAKMPNSKKDTSLRLDQNYLIKLYLNKYLKNE